MITLRRSAPRPTITCFRRSWVSGRANFTPASSIAIALASAGPIQIGRTRSPSRSCRMTTGVLVVRSSPRWATRTSITAARSGPEVPGGEVFLLLGRERVNRHAHCVELEPGDLPIELRRNAVHVLSEHGAALHDELGRERLVGEAHVHHARRMPFGCGEVYQPSVRQDEQPLPVQPPFVHELAYRRRTPRRLLEAGKVDLHVAGPPV